MKRLLALVPFFLLLTVAPVFAARTDVIAGGNETSTPTARNYWTEYISESQSNITIESDTEIWYKAEFNISCNKTDDDVATTAAATLVDLNFTLPDLYARNVTAKVRLYNSSSSLLLEEANETYADGNYGKVYFNLTGYMINGTYGTIATGHNITVTNATNTTFYIEFKLQTMDTNRSVTTASTSAGDERTYTENVSYWGPSDLSIENVTLVYAPSQYSSLKRIEEVQYDCTVVTNYTTHPDNIKYPDPNFAANEVHYFSVEYVIPIGAGASAPEEPAPVITIPGLPPIGAEMMLGFGILIVVLVGGAVLLILWDAGKLR